MNSSFALPEGDRSNSIPRMRDAIALALDGMLPPNERDTIAGYRAALATIADAFPRRLRQFQHHAAIGQVSATSRFRARNQLVNILGMTTRSADEIDDDGTWPGIVFVGCRGTSDQDHNRWVERMLARGAIVISSDKTAAIPVIANGLRLASGRSCQRARVHLEPRYASETSNVLEWKRFVYEMNPAVRLAAGHLPLLPDQKSCTSIVARDVLTDEPLVIVADIAGGHVVHSVAHWYQPQEPDSTELGQKQLASVPMFATLGAEYPDARLGTFGAGSVMLASLLIGIDIALRRRD